MARSRYLTLLLFTPMLVAGKCGKKGDAPEEIVVPPEVTQPSLRIFSVEPSSVVAGQGFQATVRGSGFAGNPTVYLGSTRMSSVTVRDENTLSLQSPALSAGLLDVTIDQDGQREVLSGALRVRTPVEQRSEPQCKTGTVYFDYDSDAITSAAREDLGSLARCISSKSWDLRLEGHTDSRGPEDYNIALGQRRAESVKSFLTGQGVSPSRIRTVSFGEERPKNRGESESAWQQNRRVELKAVE